MSGHGNRTGVGMGRVGVRKGRDKDDVNVVLIYEIPKN